MYPTKADRKRYLKPLFPVYWQNDTLFQFWQAIMIASFPPKNIRNDSMSIESAKVDSVLCFGQYSNESRFWKHIKTPQQVTGEPFHSSTPAPTEALSPHHYSEKFSTKEWFLPSMKYSENFGWRTNELGKDDYINFLKRLFSGSPMTSIIAYRVTPWIPLGWSTGFRTKKLKWSTMA